MRKPVIVLMSAAAALAASVFVVGALPADACLHPPREFKIPIKADAQKGLIFFADGRQEMVIRPGYKLDTEGMKGADDAIAGFTTVAWLIPTPNLPDNYKEVDAKVFAQLEEFTKAYDNSPEDSKHDDTNTWRGKRGGAGAKGAEFHEEVVVGDYKIQPIKAHGELGVQELKGWLKDNGFGEPKDDLVRWYTDKEYYWLAVKLHNPKGLPANGEIKPLQIGFKTDKPVYPVRIHEGAGAFDLELWLITRKEVDTDKSKAFGLRTVEQRDPMMAQANRETTFANLPKEISKVSADAEALKQMKEGKLYCYRFFAPGINDKIDLSKWDGDLSFEFKPAADAKPVD
ncbi:MAG: DUF2330 domain-containing protein [Planctomycetes bacterium]|nr:DUF2330 domain-containing protein [Planctomycetota bacterium]